MQFSCLLEKLVTQSKTLGITMKAMQDELTLEIWTNGSITPHEAISEGSEILTSLFSPFKEIDFKSKETKINHQRLKLIKY